MSIALTARDWRRITATRTVRHFGAAVGIACMLLGVGVLLYLFEKYIIQPDHRFIANPGSFMMRAGGLAHFWMGWLYLFTSPRIRNGRAILNLLLLMVVGVGVCCLAGSLGGFGNALLYPIFFCYFLIHEIRDERTIYQAYGEAPEKSPAQHAFLQGLSRTVAVFLGSLHCAGFVYYGLVIKKIPIIMSVPVWIYIAAGLVLAGFLVWQVRRTYTLARGHYGGLKNAMSAHSPLVLVYGGISAVILIGFAVGGVSLNLMILIHAGAWIAFVYHRLREQTPPADGNLWQWLRGTPTGFLVLHAAMMLLAIVLMACRVHWWERTGILSQIVARENFPYWSLMHITLAFWRPR